MRPQPRRISPSRSLAGGGRHSKHSPGSARDPMMAAETEGPTPICRCRVLYLGSSVPHITKDGLQGIQEPLKELYPEEGALGAKGIDSWLSVWSNGFLLENVDENRKKVSRFFPIDSLHYCAAVRYVQVPGTSGEKVQRFLPLDSPFARNPNINHPPLFAAILRRTTGIKVLECHVFICKRETAANALVRCSFHAYADSTYAKHLENGASLYGTVGAPTPLPPLVAGGFPNGDANREFQQSMLEVSDDSITSDRYEDYGGLGGTNGSNVISNPLNTDTGDHHLASSTRISSHPGGGSASRNNLLPNGTSSPNDNGVEDISVLNGDDNHKVWAEDTLHTTSGHDASDNIYGDYGSTMRSFRSSASAISSRQRPRQMMMQSPPPPPILEETAAAEPRSPAGGGGGNDKKEKKKKKRSKSRDMADDGMSHLMMNGGGAMSSAGSVINMPPSAGGGNGRASSMMGGRKVSAGSFMGISQNGRPPINGGPPRGQPPPPFGPYGPPPPHGGPPPPHMMMAGPGPRSKKSGTFSSRQKGVPRPIPPYMMYGPGMPPPPPGYMVPPGPPPHLMPPPGHPMYGQPPFPGGGPYPMAQEEPIYMPQHARPLSPVASYQPGHFPHDMYYSQQQYATIDKNGKHRKHKSKQQQQQQHSSNNNNNGPKPPHHPSSDSNAEDSEYGGTGIYKKEHLNERAFAHSMRAEHRSRSFGSLANLEFEPVGELMAGGGGGPAAVGGEPGYDGKKERGELMHMMDDLNLDDDRIVRSEVPPDFYPPSRRGGPPPPHHQMMPVFQGGANGPVQGRRRR